MLLNTLLTQISNLLIIALRLALHWQYHAGFAGALSSCERLEERRTVGSTGCVGMIGRRASQIWKSVPTSPEDCIHESVTTLNVIDLPSLNSANIPVGWEFSWRWQR